MSSRASVGFVATKPLQIITSLIVARQLRRRPTALRIVPAFAGASEAIARLADQDSGFDSVAMSPTRVVGLLSLAAQGASRIFLDSDVGVKTPLAMLVARLAKPRLRFSLYEEGNSLIEPQDCERPRPLFRALGAPSALGEGPLTEEVWTYTPAVVRRRLSSTTVIEIETDIADFVWEHRDMLGGVFWPSREADMRSWRGGRCCIYLSSWNVDPRVGSYLARTGVFTLSKLHPHIRDASLLVDHADQVLSGGIPAELVLLELARSFDEVEVLHHGSTASRYVRSSNVRFIHVDDVVQLASPTACGADASCV